VDLPRVAEEVEGAGLVATHAQQLSRGDLRRKDAVSGAIDGLGAGEDRGIEGLEHARRYHPVSG